jgi:hypothetical protein
MMPNADARREVRKIDQPVEKRYAGSRDVGGSGAEVASPVGAALPDFLGLGPVIVSTPLNIRPPPLVAAKIILLGDVPGRTILYAVLVVEASDRRTQKELVCP